MNKHEKDSLKKYDSIAQSYDTSLDGKFTAQFKQKMLELCPLSDGDSVLDVGCGNGRLINNLAQKNAIKAYGVDISPQMIRECRARYENIDFQVSNGEQLPFDDNSFDTVIICCVLHHLHNPKGFFLEVYRVLKAGGTLIVGEPCFPIIARLFTDWIISPLLKAGDNKLFSHKKLKGFFIENGFEITQVHKKGIIQIVTGQKILLKPPVQTEPQPPKWSR